MDSASLSQHPIFSTPATGVPSDTSRDEGGGGHGRRNIMVLRGSDLIVAVGKQLRITSLADTSAPSSSTPTYKILHAPNVDFEIEQLSLNPEGKFLAVAGFTQIAVVILPRPAYTRLVTARVDCKSLQVGQYFHAAMGAPRVAKVDWHPWARGGSGLLVMTSDGSLREYDASSQVEEPLQTLNFLPPRVHRRGFQADQSAAEVASFCFGQGKADWGPLTVYAVMKSGDMYAMCPVLPVDAHIPERYLLALECFVKTKRDIFVSSPPEPSLAQTSEEMVFDRQFKFVHSLLKQQPLMVRNGMETSSSSRLVHIHRPETGIGSYLPLRQGPFLLTPAPEESEDGSVDSASDVAYILCRSKNQDGDNAGDPEDEDGETHVREENLGVLLMVHGSGRIDVCLDTDKVSALWENNHFSNPDSSLPVLTVYETIDLGLASSAAQASAEVLLSANAPAFSISPWQHDMIYVSHALGVHSLDISPWSFMLTQAMLRDNSAEKRSRRVWADVIETAPETDVFCILDTFSPEHKASAPIVALSLVNNPYISNTLLALTDSLQLIPLDLSLQSALPDDDVTVSHTTESQEDQPLARPDPYVSLTSAQPYRMPSLSAFTRSAIPPNPANRYQSAESLRALGRHSELIITKAHELVANLDSVRSRVEVQRNEFQRQVEKLGELSKTVDEVTAHGQHLQSDRLKNMVVTQRLLLERMDKVLRIYRTAHSATLTEAEAEWFAELQQLDDNVQDMKTKAALARHRYDLMRNDAVQSPPRAAPLGALQRESIENRLWAENKLLLQAKQQLEALTASIDGLMVV